MTSGRDRGSEGSEGRGGAKWALFAAVAVAVAVAAVVAVVAGVPKSIEACIFMRAIFKRRRQNMQQMQLKRNENFMQRPQVAGSQVKFAKKLQPQPSCCCCCSVAAVPHNNFSIEMCTQKIAGSLLLALPRLTNKLHANSSSSSSNNTSSSSSSSNNCGSIHGSNCYCACNCQLNAMN